MLFKSLVVSETAYDLAFQDAEPIYTYEEGVFGDDRTQQRDDQTGFPVWRVRVTASDARNREEQTLEVQITAKDRPTAEFKEKVLLPNLRVQAYSRKTERGINSTWYADAFTTAVDAAKTPKIPAKAAA